MTTAIQGKFDNKIYAALQECRATTGLSEKHLSLVQKYLFHSQATLFKDPKGWIAECTGERGREVVAQWIMQSTPLSPDTAGLIAQYLQKGDIFGAEKLKKATRGDEGLQLLFRCDVIPPSLPIDIDDEMQMDLNLIFDTVALKEISEERPGAKKMTDIESLYLCPKGITAKLAEKLAQKWGQKFHENSWQAALQEHGDRSVEGSGWIGFVNIALWRNRAFAEQSARVPLRFAVPHVALAVYCPFMKWIDTGEMILSDNPWRFTRTQQRTQGSVLAVGGLGARGLIVYDGNFGSASHGVVPVRTFCWTLVLGPLAIGMAIDS
jgi:hypothetical protein